MKWILLRNLSLRARNQLLRSPLYTSNAHPSFFLSPPTTSRFRLFSSDNDSPPNEDSQAVTQANLVSTQKKEASLEVQDVSNKEFKTRIEKYFKGDEEALSSILEAILRRKLAGKHEDTDDELVEELRMKPLEDVKDREFESDFEELHDTDEEIDDLYYAKNLVMERMAKDEYFNMDDKKWEDIVQDAVNHGILNDTKECEAILEDMLNWDKLLPDDLKEKVEAKFNELGDLCEKGELEPEEAYNQFKKYEDEVVMEYGKMMEAEAPTFDETDVQDNKKDLDDPPGEGPILRWQTRVVFAPGGDAWHPKNRKVKLSVTVKELGLSKYQFRRLRELVGKRYHPGKDELTITSERFEHREENRKDCLRTLFSLIEEAGKANKLVEDAQTLYVKERLRANPQFMERLRSKKMSSQVSSPQPA
ncbi:28S ribosomal S35 [Cucumis melo var. makuwa]|uniref:28S ribosomal S35 n=1 Tax=Cucumis melo var. makuwa TaxID=1194695 RepID=A0A5D3DYZ3_CUCMM|nr:28S ribosomal S35 [Cucumis melo var. makuwa]